MGRTPVKKVNLRIATPLDPMLFKDATVVKPTGTTKAPDPRLAEVVAALRRELEAVALIAASDDREVPRFHLAEAEMDFSFAVTDLEDDGVRVAIDRERLAEVPDNQVHRMKLKVVDADVQALIGRVKQD